MTDRTAEKGAIQYAIENPSAPVSRIGAAGYIQGVANDLATGRLSATTSTLAGRGALIAKIANSPSLLFDFTDSATAKIGSATLTYTGSNGTYFNSSGTLTAATTNVPRLDYNPATLVARGLLIEEARTNSIRNNTMVGASAGTPGTLPTNWSYFNPLTLTTAIVAVGTSAGISYIDVRLSGTAGAGGVFHITPETTTQVAASSGQSWTGSTWQALVGGSSTNITSWQLFVSGRDGSSELESSAQAFTPTATLTRTSVSRTLNNAGTLYALPYIRVTVTAAGAVDFTLRIGMPQLELGAFATSVISTSSAAVTRTADIASITGASFSSFWNATQGTIVTNAASLDFGTGTARHIAQANDGTASNYIGSYFRAGATGIQFEVKTGGVQQAGIGSVTGLSANTFYKVAAAYKANDCSAAFSGALGTPDTSGTLPTVTQMTIGSDGTSALNGWISSLAYYTTRKTDSQLQALST